MAATRLIALHVNKGKSVAQCLADRTNYSQNAEKTNNGEFISSYDALRLFRKFDKHRFVSLILSHTRYISRLAYHSGNAGIPHCRCDFLFSVLCLRMIFAAPPRHAHRPRSRSLFCRD